MLAVAAVALPSPALAALLFLLVPSLLALLGLARLPSSLASAGLLAAARLPTALS